MGLSFRVKKTADVVFEYLTDMQKFVSVHPVINQIENRGGENYLIHERLKVWIVPFSFRYPVTIEKDSVQRLVTYKATVMKLVHFEMNFAMQSDNDFTLVEENIRIKSRLPIEFVLQSVLKKQHALLFKNIEKA